MWLPSDGSDEWLSHTDILVSLLLLRTSGGSGDIFAQKSFLEIGVWKGAYSAVLLKNLGNSRGFGVDPFPGRPELKKSLNESFRRLHISSRWTLYSSWAGFSGGNHGLMDLIHVDGEHSERAATRDLQFSANHLSESGILVVDDYRHFWFPGVGSALYRFIHSTDFRVLAMTEKKAYLVRRPFLRETQELLEGEVETEVGLRAYRSIDDRGPDFGFRQKPDVEGESVVLIPDA